jgi:competence protein ComEA
MIAGACRARPSRQELPHRAVTAPVLCVLLGVTMPMCWALEVNSASRAELEQLPGLGPAKVDHLLKERDKAVFASWQDLSRRVPGFGTKTSAVLSREGLTVNQQPFRSTEPPADNRRPALSP